MARGLGVARAARNGVLRRGLGPAGWRRDRAARGPAAARVSAVWPGGRAVPGLVLEPFPGGDRVDRRRDVARGCSAKRLVGIANARAALDNDGRGGGRAAA